MTPERRIRLDLAYDGTEFAGWQFQPGQRTVQGELEAALSALQGAAPPVSVRGAGRTDSGVHARHQVADCLLRTRLDDVGVALALGRMLPSDLRPLAVRTTPHAFHARKDALSKTYVYRLDTSASGDPFAARYALHYPHALELDLLAAALAELPGRRDWSGFAASTCDKQDRVRELSAAELTRRAGGLLELSFTADGFLRHMVRNIVGTLLEIGSRRMPPETLADVLTSGDRDRAGPTAAPHGLCLVRVRYAADPPAAGPGDEEAPAHAAGTGW